MEGTPPRLAFFVSPHGYGHAARSSAVMAALHRKSGVEFELYTTVGGTYVFRITQKGRWLEFPGCDGPQRSG